MLFGKKEGQPTDAEIQDILKMNGIKMPKAKVGHKAKATKANKKMAKKSRKINRK